MTALLIYGATGFLVALALYTMAFWDLGDPDDFNPMNVLLVVTAWPFMVALLAIIYLLDRRRTARQPKEEG